MGANVNIELVNFQGGGGGGSGNSGSAHAYDRSTCQSQKTGYLMQWLIFHCDTSKHDYGHDSGYFIWFYIVHTYRDVI